MTTLTRSHEVFVRAPLEKVFEYVSDLERHPEWSEGELKIEPVTPGPVAIGKEYTSRGEVSLQKERPNMVQVTAYEPPRRFAFDALDPDAGRVTHEFTFEEREDGTLIRREMTLSLPLVLAILFRFLVYPLIGSPSMEKALRKLRERLEE